MTSRQVATLVVDTEAQGKAPERVASGSLYGIAGPGRPPATMVGALRPKSFTQMAPGGEQLPNGELRPSGDATVVAPIADAVGASIIVRLADTFPTFPYRWTSWSDWAARVRAAIALWLEAGHANLYGFELWNEPNWTWPSEAGPFQDGWARTAGIVREADPSARLVGPSIDRWDASWMETFLVDAKATRSLPHVASWHELDPADSDVVTHVAEYRALEAKLGIDPRPVSINEYGAHRDMGVPSALARWIAALERSGADSANLAFWHRPGRLADLVTTDGRPTGAWWVYRWYAGVDAVVLPTTVVGAIDGFGGRNASGTLTAVVGTAAAGDIQVGFRGLTAEWASGATVRVLAAPWTGTDGACDAPELRFEAPLITVGGVACVTIADASPLDAYCVTVTPASGEPAEVVYGTKRWRLDASAGRTSKASVANDPDPLWGRYVVIERGGHLTLQWACPKSGPYDLRVRAWAAGAATSQLRVTALPSTATVDVEPTAEQYPRTLTPMATITMAAGRSTIEIEALAGPVAIAYIDVAPYARSFEAEDAKITRGSVIRIDERPRAFHSNTASGGAYVGWLNEIGSRVAVAVAVPTAGTYRLTIVYANAGSEAVLRLHVDGIEVGIEQFPPTQGSELFGLRATQVTLEAGLHEIALDRGIGPGAIELDRFDIRFESAAEDAPA